MFRRLSIQDRKLETGNISDGPRPVQKENWFRRNWERLREKEPVIAVKTIGITIANTSMNTLCGLEIQSLKEKAKKAQKDHPLISKIFE